MILRSLWFVAVVAALVAASVPAHAEHGMPWVVSSPKGPRLPPNGRVILLSSNGVSWIVASLHARSRALRVYFRRGATRIPVKVVDAFDDLEGGPRQAFASEVGYGDSLLVLKPRRALRPRAQYELVARYRGKVANAKWVTLELGSWTIAAQADRRRPRWLEAPLLEYRRNRYERRDDGYLIASVGGETGPLTVVATLRPVRPGPAKRLVWVFDPGLASARRRNTLDGGRGEHCQVAHLFGTQKDVGRSYLVTLTAVDIAGNQARAPGKPFVMAWPKTLGLNLCLRRALPAAASARRRTP